MRDVRALKSLLLALAMLAGLGATAAAENWAQWRGPGGQGVSADTRAPTEWAPGKNIAWKAELPGTGMSSPIVWGNRIYLTAVIEGDAIPGQRAVKHRQGQEQDWIHPDSVAADKKHTFKVVALDASSGKILWDRTAYEGTVFDARHRRSSFAGPTPVTDGVMVFAYFGPEGLYAYDAKGDLAWKSVTPFATLGLGTGTSPVLYENLVIIQRDEDNGEQSVLVAYDKKSGKEVWNTKRTVEITWSTPVLGTERRPHRARHERQRADHCLRSRDGERAVAHDRCAEQRHPHAARRPWAGDRDRRLSGQESHRAAPGRSGRERARRLGVLQRHGLRPLEHPLRRLPLPLHGQRHRHLPRSEDRHGQVPKADGFQCRPGSWARLSRSAGWSR